MLEHLSLSLLQSRNQLPGGYELGLLLHDSITVFLSVFLGHGYGTVSLIPVCLNLVLSFAPHSLSLSLGSLNVAKDNFQFCLCICRIHQHSSF